MPEATAEDRKPPSAGWVAAETFAATTLGLYVSLRLETPLVWLLLPLGILVACRVPLSDYGLDLRFRPPPWTTHLVLGGSLLILYGAAHAWFVQTILGQRFVPRLPSAVPLEIVREFLAIGVPEEVFFRGYLQTRWNLALGRPWKLFGASIGPAFYLQAAIFALCHLATGDPTRLRVFFFALLAGWLRERSGSILGPATYHAVANVWYRVLVGNFR